MSSITIHGRVFYILPTIICIAILVWNIFDHKKVIDTASFILVLACIVYAVLEGMVLVGILSNNVEFIRDSCPWYKISLIFVLTVLIMKLDKFFSKFTIKL